MLSKCLNPQCSAIFRYLGEGRLFRIDYSESDRRRNAPAGGAPVLCAVEKRRPVEHFWLCAECASTMKVEVSEAGAIQLVCFPDKAQKDAESPAGKAVAAQAS